jgi:hypothetical protein
MHMHRAAAFLCFHDDTQMKVLSRMEENSNLLK